MKKGCESVSFFIYTHLCINLPKVLKINKEAATFETASFCVRNKKRSHLFRQLLYNIVPQNGNKIK